MSEEFSTGVKILLQRMESHPEEFFNDSNNSYKAMRDPKWHILMTSVLQVKFKESARGDAMFFTEAEADAVYAGYCKLRRKAFDDYVMREILGVDEEVTDDDAQAKMHQLQAQFGQQKIRLQAANNNINQMQGLYDVNTNQYISPHQQAVGLMNANPYQSSQDPHPQDNPQTQSMLSKMAKGLRLK